MTAFALALASWSGHSSRIAAHDGQHTALYRVNAGGPSTSGTPTWVSDTSGAPSPYSNVVAASSATFTTSTPINVSDPSIPAGTPATLFQTERYDRPSGADMQWSFPVAPGSYEVRLYFAEIYLTGPGARVFSVAMEGVTVLPNYDIFAEVGKFKGVVKSFTVVADSSLDIVFMAVVENPKINAIEILDPATRPGQLGANPETANFGPILVGQRSRRTVQLTNLGGTGDPNIDIFNTTIAGVDANLFADNFTDGATVTLAPGQSTTLDVSFAPDSSGAKSASLEIGHSGVIGPLVIPLGGTGATTPAGAWASRAPSGFPRQEVAYVQLNGKFYLAGGSQEHEVYDPATNTWKTLTPLPANVDHVQAVALGGRIYYVGGLLGWPQPASSSVLIYDPATDTTTQGTAMSRPRGAGGVAVHNGKIYYAGGLAAGTAVNWFDMYDPVANTWTALANMPVARDHFQAVVVDGKFYVTGGRATAINATISSTIAFDFGTGSWTTGLAPIPTQRGGFGAAALGTEMVIIGGEGEGLAFNTVEAYDTVNNTWRTLASMPTARHGIQAAECNGGIYVAAGGQTQGSSNPTNVHEVFFLGDPTTCETSPPPGPVLGTSPTTLDFGNLLVGQTVTAAVQLTNLGSAQLVVDATGMIGTDASQFADTFNDANDVTLAPGGTMTVTVAFSPSSSGTKTAALQIVHSGGNSPLQLPLTGSGASAPPATSGVIFRVNAGGPAVSGAPTWTADTSAAPSQYTNAAAASSATYQTTKAINVSDPSVPVGTPASLFQTERYDATAGAEMLWSFPVSPGTYQVRLYFAEIFQTTAGARVFNVTIEGSKVLSSYDIFADVGAFKGVVKSFTVTADTSIDVAFGRVIQNPKISAIEIIADAPKPGELGVSPSSVSFGDLPIGQSGSRALQVTNLGGLGAPNITVNSTTITGTDSSQFGDSFNGTGTVTLQPQQSTTITVTFSPTAAGGKSATLRIAHSGTNSPLDIPLQGTATPAAVGFQKSSVAGSTGLTKPTSIQFGPDGRLYVGQQDGLIRIYTVVRNAANTYAVTATQTINSIQSTPNHNDDGTVNAGVTTRLITGLLVAGTATDPVVYVAHSDPRIGGGTSGSDLNLDTNSSMISRLAWTGSVWQKVDLVRGLPRSEENHAANGMQLDAANNILYLAMGGNTNKGATSNNFAYLPEVALSAAVLSIDLNAIGSTTYDLPTLDDETRAGNPDAGDPFGGNNGRNQARLVPGGPVQVYAPGFRNPFDLVRTESGRLYTVDNGGNSGWGNVPIGEGPAGACTNAPNEPGTTSPDSLHLITGPGYYGGHPNPTRANMANTFNPSNPQSPVTVANPIECDYREAGSANGALATFPASTNGLAEYTTPNFGGALQGNLLATSWNGVIHRVQLNQTGTAAQVSTLFSSVGSMPLDVVALGPDSPFPGTIWVALYGASQILAFEPNDYETTSSACTGTNSTTLDEDRDGYTNSDEIDNGVSPCSAADVPRDRDQDFLSDLNDLDDDNDGLPDTSDPFALDPTDGLSTRLPVSHLWENDGSSPGGILNTGFTGLMTNGVSNYAALYNPDQMTAGGAAGVLTVDEASEGDALGTLNTQQHGFQLGLSARPTDTGTFLVHTRILAPFAGSSPQDGQSMGVFIGTGNQDDYAKLVVSGTGGGGIAFLKEVGGAVGPEAYTPVALPGPNYIDLYLRVDPVQGTVQPFYSLTSAGITGPEVVVATPQSIPASWFTNSVSGLAIGLISTSRGPGLPFPATWDFIRAVPAAAAPTLGVSASSLSFGDVTVGQTKSVAVQLTNLGSTNMVVDATTITGTEAAQFTDNFDDAGDVILAPSASTTITVTLAATSTGSKSAMLQIAHSGSNSPLQLALTGSGIAPAAPTLGVSPSSMSFGNVTVGQTKSLAVQLTNLGSTNVVVDATTITGTNAAQFTDSFNDAGDITLIPGAAITVTVRFDPTSTGNKSATLQILHSGGNTPVQVPLTGMGKKKN